MDVKSLYKVKINELDRCAEIIAESFEGDPLMHYFLNSEDYKVNKIASFYKVIVKAAFEVGYIYATSEKMEGIIIWFPENSGGISDLKYIKHGGLALSFKIRIGIQKTLLAYSHFATRLQKKHADMKHWYLFTLVVQKKYQKKGFSSKLLTPFFSKFDDNAIFCYLETHKKINVDIYKHFGFELLEDAKIPKTNIQHYAMLRSPK